MAKQQWKAGNMLYPLPAVMVSVTDAKGKDNIITVAGAKHTITSREVGEETLRQLYNLSPVAYVRFASVYRRFDNLEQFVKEIENLASRR